MYQRLLKASLIGLCLICVFLVVGGVSAEEDPTLPRGETCTDCHEGLRNYWQHSQHAKALDDPTFQSAWEEANQDPECLSCHTTGFDPATGQYAAEGVTCTTCHYPIPKDHPDDYIPTDVSPRLCGQCHLDTYTEWEQSQHGAEDMACSQCHNPHTTELRAGDAQNLCQTCHQDEALHYAYTAHASQGLLCTDCHLRVNSSDMGQGHGQRQHTFSVDLSTCSSCHSTEMHAAADAMSSQPTADQIACFRSDALPLVDKSSDVSETAPTQQLNPWSLALTAGFGIFFGVFLGPLISSWRRRPQGEM